MGQTVSRRQFIKIGAASSAGVAAAASVPSLLGGRRARAAAGDHDPTPPGVVVKHSYCEMCFWKCAVRAYVTPDDRIWKLEGNPDDPLTRGRLCPRGTGGIGTYTDPDRLRTPLIRTEKRGEQVFREASWDEALGLIAERLEDVKRRHGPECAALFYHGSGGAYFKQLMKAYGSLNVAAPSYAQCRGPREVAFQMTFGQGVGSPENTDIENARCLVLIGSHLGENMHNSQVQELSRAVSAGADIIVVDPRFSTVAGKARHWLPIRPATDMALLLAWIQVIIEERLYDAEYVETYTYGFEQLAAAVATNTPEWAWPLTGIEPRTIRETARMMARNAPATIVHPGRHVTWYGDDTQRVRAVAILNALLGAWGRRGGFYLSAKARVPAYPYPHVDPPERTWRTALGDKYPMATLALAHELCDASMPWPVQPCNLKAWIVYGTNLALTMPNFAAIREGLDSLDLLAVVDILPSEITGWADVVLPEAGYLERGDDLRLSGYKVPSIALRDPVVPPVGDSKPGWWITKRLAEKMGLGSHFPWSDLDEYLRTRLEGTGVTLEQLRERGCIALDRVPITWDEGLQPEFSTPTGKIELYSTALADKGFDPIPRYTHHEQPPPGMFRLLYGRSPVHTFGRSTNNPLLLEIKDTNRVWINADVAADLGIADGDWVSLTNQDGVESNVARAKVTQRIRGDCVFVVHGFGHSSPLMGASFQQGISDSGLITRYARDPVMGGTGMRVNFVSIQRREAPSGAGSSHEGGEEVA